MLHLDGRQWNKKPRKSIRYVVLRTAVILKKRWFPPSEGRGCWFDPSRARQDSKWHTFDTKAEAQAWARRLESEMDRGTFVDRTEAERNSFGDLLQRYAREVSALKK